MSTIDLKYHKLLQTILDEGFVYEDLSRKQTCLQINSYNMEIDLSRGFPLLTTKKMFFKGIITELIWFLRGSTNIKYLIDNGCGIWNKDAYNWYLLDARKTGYKPVDLEDFVSTIKSTDYSQLSYNPRTNYRLGDVGFNYGHQWRNYKGVDTSDNQFIGIKCDQIKNLLIKTKNHPFNRRNIVTAWNPTELDKTALPPCHWAFELLPRQTKNGELQLDLKWHQRSVDTFLGLPFNIASYAALNMLFSKILGMEPGKLYADLSNVHIYESHLKCVEEQLTRDIYKHPTPKLEINIDVTDKTVDDIIDELTREDFKLVGYTSEKSLIAPMIAPKSL